METFHQDLRYGFRMLAKSPAVGAMAVMTLALGIGANTAIFSVVNALLLRPLPFAQPDRLVTVWSTNPRFDVGFANLPVSTGDFNEWREQNKSFEGMSAVATGSINVTGGAQPVRIPGAFVSPNFFGVMGVDLSKGRAFSTEEEEPGHEAVIVISDDLWRERFGGDSDVVGKTLAAEDKSYTIIGVAPRGFRFPHVNDLPAFFGAPPRPEFWAPLALSQAQKRSKADHQLAIIARLKPDASVKEARVEMNTIARIQEANDPKGNQDVGALVIPLQDLIVGGTRPALLVLMCATAFVLTIGCANVANLQLTRATARQREIAVRAALGASRWRIARQLINEGLILSLVGGGAGLLLDLLCIRALLGVVPTSVPRLDEITTDWRVLCFSLLLSVLTGVVFGLAPAIQASKTDLNESLKEGARSSSGGARGRVRALLVVAEIALSVVLLTGAGLMIKSFWRLVSVDPGFDSSNTITASVNLSRVRYADESRQRAFFNEFLSRVRTLPGVNAVGAISGLPLSGAEYAGGFSIESQAEGESDDSATADRRAVSPGYFEAMGIRLVSGRVFDEHDLPDSRGVAIVSGGWVQRFLNGERAIGQRVKLGGRDSNRPWLTIVGVVGDVHQHRLDSGPRPCIYYPYTQRPSAGMALVVRSGAEPSSIIASIRSELGSLDKDQPLNDVGTMRQYLAESLAAQRFNAGLMAMFGGLAVILAAVGIYGVMAYAVARRGREIGIRLALGAQRLDIVRLMLVEGLTLASAGVAIGLMAAFALTRLTRALLFEVSPTDPATFLIVPALLVVVALVACLEPLRRATTVDPAVSLRCE